MRAYSFIFSVEDICSQRQSEAVPLVSACLIDTQKRRVDGSEQIYLYIRDDSNRGG